MGIMNRLHRHEAAQTAADALMSLTAEEFLRGSDTLGPDGRHITAAMCRVIAEALTATADRMDTEQGELHGDQGFGVCPECQRHDGYINVGKGHWFYCRQHRTRWFVGSNLFSTWQQETDKEQRDNYEAMEFNTYHTIDVTPKRVPIRRSGALGPPPS